MASFNTTLNVILKNEGGYTCSFPGSGETYRGIDRNYSNDWQGWPIIDTLKRDGKIDPRCYKKAQIVNDRKLNDYVTNWYSSKIKTYFENFEGIKNQTLADFTADFAWHKPFRLIPIVNSIAKQLAPAVQTSPNIVTNGVVAIMNLFPGEFYKRLRNTRIAYYNNPKSVNASWDEKFITTKQGLLNRVNSFPSSISGGIFSFLFK